MTLISPTTLYNITTALTISALCYSIIKINCLNCNLKKINIKEEHIDNYIKTNRNLIQNQNQDINNIKILLKENANYIDKLKEDTIEIKTTQTLHENHINKLKELCNKEDENPVKNKKKNS